MPGKVKVKIVAGRNLPVMDRSSDTTDPYVEIKLGNTTYKTDVCRKSLNPQWNSEWYRFEVDDSELQDEPLQIRLMDHDTYSANDAIGKVYVDLNPLLLPVTPCKGSDSGSGIPRSSGSVVSGWLPVYDTMHGIRGEVYIIVKVELFSDFNKFRQSSCGVQFFFSATVPQGYHAQVIHGFVEELVVNDDPEYQWIDKIRTPRASNEARQTLLLKLSGEVQRKIGLKALDLGGNAVIGYCQNFDLEGESGIVARGIGTAVTLVKIQESGPLLDPSFTNENEHEAVIGGSPANLQPMNPQVAIVRSSHSPAKVCSLQSIHRRSSDSDLSITPKGNSLTGSDRSTNARDSQKQSSSYVRPTMNQESLDMLEYPFITMSKYPTGLIQHLGGTVSARSVKLLERITNLEEPETRDAWWTELRMEVRSHARAMGCNVVLGYSETTSICDDVCVLSASGTAAVVNLNASTSEDVFSTPTSKPSHPLTSSKDLMTCSLDRTDFEKETNKCPNKTQDSPLANVINTSKTKSNLDSSIEAPEVLSCIICHIPYSETSVPFRVNMQKCAVCRKGKVPDVLFTTIEVPDNVQVTGKGCVLYAYVCRPKRDCKGELNAKEISDSLPFLEYELHRLLINKLKVRGMNSIFKLKIQVSIGEKLLVGLATGTAVFLTALPAPPIPKVSGSDSWRDGKKIAEMQKQLQDAVKKNKDFYQLKDLEPHNVNGRHVSEDTDDSEEDDLPDLDLTAGNKDTFILEVDDAADADVISLLIDPRPPEGFHLVNSEVIPGLDDLEIIKNIQMFTQIYRVKIPFGPPYNFLNKHLNKLLQNVCFKHRHMVPCGVSNLQFKVSMEQDEIQMSVLGMSLGLGEKKKPKVREQIVKKEDSELIFNLEEVETSNQQVRSRSPVRWKIPKHDHTPPRERYGVDITPLSYIPGTKIERYLGNLNFFFIRESTCIREGGGLSGFVHSFVTEVLAIVRAHVTALGGNAMVGYFMSECCLYHYPHKNQAQCLINVGGDVVNVTYYPDE